MAIKLGRTVTYFDGLLPIKSHDSWIGLIRSHDTFKPLYLHCHSAYSCQTWQNGNLSSWGPAFKVRWPFNHVVLEDHVTSYNHYISNVIMPIAIKVARMITYLDELLPKSHMTFWSSGLVRSHGKLKSLYFQAYSKIRAWDLRPTIWTQHLAPRTQDLGPGMWDSRLKTQDSRLQNLGPQDFELFHWASK